MAIPFGTLPADAEGFSPFKISISDEQISDFKSLLKLSKLGPQTFEGLQQDRKYGITTEWLADTKEKWEKEFDWRSSENHMNSFPQFTTEIEGLTVHFVALFSEKKDAIPIVWLHGWPGNFLEFLPILSLFRDEYKPDTLPYHLVVPSLPGYAFSSGPPLDREFNGDDISRVMNQLMVNLGFGGGYVTQGGDIGSRVARAMGVKYDGCKAVHLNACFMSKPDDVSDDAITLVEKRGLERGRKFIISGVGYALEQGTRPSTIGHVLSSSPLALLAWVGEKFLDWVDSPLPLQTILESISLYWFTETYPRAIYPYRSVDPVNTSSNAPLQPKESPHDATKSKNPIAAFVPFHGAPKWYLSKPLGYSYFPKELQPSPKKWVEKTGKLVFFREHEKGGHFAALERPTDLKNDVSAFVDQLDWS